MQPVLQVFQAVTAIPMGHSSALEATATSGVLPRSLQQTPGPGAWTTTTHTYAITTALRVMDFQFVVSGINDYFNVSFFNHPQRIVLNEVEAGDRIFF